MIETKNINTEFKNKFIELQNNEVVFQNWTVWNYIKVYLNSERKMKDWVVIVCVNQNNELLLINNYRYAIDRFVLEFPRWKYNLNEDCFDWSIRELYEETWINDIISSKLLGSIFTDTWFICWEVDIIQVNVNSNDLNIILNEEENIISYKWINISSLKKMILDWNIKDWFTHSWFIKYIINNNL